MNEAERDRPRSVSCRVAHMLPLRSHCFYTAARGVSMVRGAGWKNIPEQFTSLEASQQVKSCGYIPSYVIQRTFSKSPNGRKRACQVVCVHWYNHAHAVVVVQVSGCDGERANEDLHAVSLWGVGSLVGVQTKIQRLVPMSHSPPPRKT